MIDYDVDLVVTFVDNKEAVWRETYGNYCIKYGRLDLIPLATNERFDNPGLFEYWWKCVDKFMPWIRRIFLIVSNKEQVPDYILKDKTTVILHKDIMPAKFLPTFNSTSIEMFIPRIPGLAEHFIYSNDDMFPVAPLTKEDFFTEDGKIRVAFKDMKFTNQETNQFHRVCWNNYRDVVTSCGKTLGGLHYIRPRHTMSAMLLSDCKECIDLVFPKIEPYISAFRTDKQHNQYIYPIYSHLMGHTADMEYPFMYISLKIGASYIAKLIHYQQNKMICINDVKIPNRNKYPFNLIKDAFEEILK